MLENTLLSFPWPFNFLHATALQLIRLSLICTNLKTANCVTQHNAVCLIMFLVQVSAASLTQALLQQWICCDPKIKTKNCFYKSFDTSWKHQELINPWLQRERVFNNGLNCLDLHDQHFWSGHFLFFLFFKTLRQWRITKYWILMISCWLMVASLLWTVGVATKRKHTPRAFYDWASCVKIYKFPP